MRGGLTQPLVIVGFNRLVILITYGMRYFTMEAVSLVCTFAQDRSSSTMCVVFTKQCKYYDCKQNVGILVGSKELIVGFVCLHMLLFSKAGG